LYLTGDVPFKTVHLHARCTDSKGQKMSKSKGNVVDPLIMSEKYGTDALRMSLVYGIAPASDFVISEDKIRAQRNFVNKIWNATRFILMKIGDLNPSPTLPLTGQGDQDNVNILDKLKKIVKSTTDNLNKYRFGQASEDLYQFFWHDFCDVYIESTKNKGPEVIPVLIEVLVTSLKLLHPFMPFVTETIYQETKEVFKQKEKMLITSTWPK